MSDLQGTEAVTAFISEFAEALSSPDFKSIGNFYAADGIFFPNNHPTLSKRQLENPKGKFLKNRKFKIDFRIYEIEIKADFAFVSAFANTSTTDLEGGLITKTESRDLFVLRKETTWKIYRYMFNDFKRNN